MVAIESQPYFITVKLFASMSEEKETTIAYYLIAIVGVGYLFPFSALTQPVDFWNHEFPDFNIEFPLTTLYMWVNLIVLALIVFSGRKPSYTFRIVGGFIGQTAVLVLVPSLYFFHLSEYSYYIWIMIATSIAAVVTALVDSVAIGFAAHFPLKVQEGLQLGIGLSTLIGSIYRIGTKLVFPADEVVMSSLLYFYAGALTIVFCIFTYYRLLNMDIAKKYFFHIQAPLKPASYGSMLDDEDSGLLADAEACRQMGIQASPSSQRKAHDKIDKWAVFHKVAFNEFLVFLLFFSTLLLWPPLVTEIPSYNFPSLQESRWWSLLLLLLFAVLDCIGRILVPYRCGLTSSNIYLPVIARLLLIPLLVCSAKQMYFTNDLWSVLFVGILGFSNGYVGSLAVMMVSEVVTADEKGVAGSFTGFFLNLGLVFGATAAMGLKAWLDSW